MLDPFEAFDPSSDARAIHQALLADGWQPFTPKARGGKSKSEAAYIRFLHEGTARTARLYLNSIAAYMQGIGERGFCAPLPGADIQPNGDVYFYFGGTKTEQVIDVAGKLRGWSNNAPDAS